MEERSHDRSGARIIGDGPTGSASTSSASIPETAGAGIDEALRNEERSRARAFFRAFQIIAVLTFGFVPFLPGSLPLRGLAGGALLAGFAACTAGLAVVKRDAASTDRLVAAVGVACAVTGVVVVHYVGIFSAGAMALAIGVYFFAASQSRLVARSVFATIAGLYFVSSAGVAAGLLADDALFPASTAAPFTRWFQVFMSQVILGLTFYMGRQNRRGLQAALERVQAQGRQIRQRDAQLAEARQELDRALRPGHARRSGETLGPYVLGPLLGRGGMGEVYRATHVSKGDPVAIKVLHTHLIESDQHRRLFMREAEMAALVTSRHIVRLLDVGETRDGAPYLAMELLDGHDLAWILRKSGKLELPEVIELVDHVEEALVVLRGAGVVHRDLKPGNLFLTDSGPRTWKVLDFGVAKGLGTSTSMTRDQMLGTPAYMPPEQLRGESGPATDLYAVAAIAYRALTGAAPFDGDDVARVVFKVAYEQPPDPAKFVRLPSDVELVLAIGMAKSAEDRFATIEAFAAALRAASTGDLDDETRSRGWQLLRRAPWGSSRRDSEDVSLPGPGRATIAMG